MPEEQPVEGQDPQAAAPPAPAAPVVNDGPWANDLASLFPDEATRGQVDQFLRSKVQPYTTQLEQRASVSQDAQNLWSALEANPIDAYVDITTQMFGEEAGQAILAQLQQTVDGGQQYAPAPTQPAPAPTQQPLDPRLESVVNWAEQTQNERAYEDELARVAAANPDVNTDHIHAFVAAAEGDFDRAVAMYREMVQQLGVPVIPEVPPEAPNTMGSDTGGQTSAAPVEKQYGSIGEAIEDFMAEQRAAKQAPPVS